ncbi:anaphase-promoting complex subunit 10 isoform X2 [Gorilla gorilla gorilla]|uniref:anaphase-promoting complex subunit 10 isoform X2 n=1 Tax=Pan troglodytes TaxID=9598 RepID=UPI0007DB9AE1|nr:anaphase-promoting complex subunit 10 isoform X2 [Pan troglodytes]XP_055241566.1 anaphase-promoting complex subunit 10 isoform X2 [Gorilla gorilla gorilla]
MTTPNKTPPGADPKQLERTGTVREIGSQAVWSLSSCKPGFGVDQLRDDNLETYWQSDGSQPHLVNIQFRRKTTVKTLCIYADYKSDESYTPSKISVRVGNNFHNLQEIRPNLAPLPSELPGTSNFRGIRVPCTLLLVDLLLAALFPTVPFYTSQGLNKVEKENINLSWWNQVAGFMFP